MFHFQKVKNKEQISCYLCISEKGIEKFYGFRRERNIMNHSSLYIIGSVFDNSMRLVSDATVLHALKSGIESLKHFQGDFAGVFVDGKQIYIFSDRMCIRKIYYSLCNHNICISTRMDDLAYETNQLDIAPEAIAELLYEHAVVGHTSWYNGIRALQMGQYATYSFTTKHKIDEIFYDSSFLQTPMEKSMEEYSRELAYALEQTILDACHTIKPHNCALTLTAGWDSRLVASVLKKHGITPTSLVVDTDQGYDEIAFTKRINEDYYRFPLMPIAQNDNYYINSITDCIDAMEYTMCEHLWFHEALKPAADTNCVFITGLAASNMLRVRCDELLNMSAFYSTNTESQRISDYCQKRIVSLPFLKTDFQEYLQEKYASVMEKELLPFLYTENGGYSWYTVTRTSNQIMRIAEIMRPNFRCVHPFCSNRFLDLALRSPLKMQGPDLYKAIFQNIDPQAWEIPSSNNAPEYKKTLSIPYKKFNADTINFLVENIKSGMLAETHLIDTNLLDDYVSANKSTKLLRTLSLIYTYEKRLQKTDELKRK